MGIFSRRKDKKVENLSTSRNFFWGGTSSGVHVNEQTAMQSSAVYACILVISQAVASLPLHVYKYESIGSRMAPEHELYDLLHFEPNPDMSSFVFRQTLMMHLLLYGNAYAHIIRTAGGRIKAIYPLFPEKMTVNRAPNNEIYYTYWRSQDENLGGEKNGAVTLRREEVLHIPGLSFDGLVGYSPIAVAKNAIGIALATEEYGATFFANNANPGGVLEHPGALQNKDKIAEAWEAMFSGSKRRHGVAVLEEGMKYNPITVSPNEAQFLETRKYQLNDIARIFRVPPHMIGDLDKSSFSNIEMQSLEFVVYTLDPWVVRWEQAMQRALLLPSEKRDYFIKFNVNGLLRGDYKSRMEGYATGRQNGWLSANDIRELEDMDKIPVEEGGDLFLVNGNMKRLTGAEGDG